MAELFRLVKYCNLPRYISSNMGFGCPFLVPTILKRGYSHPVFVVATFWIHKEDYWTCGGCISEPRPYAWLLAGWILQAWCVHKVTPWLWTLTNINSKQTLIWNPTWPWTCSSHVFFASAYWKPCPWSDVSVIWEPCPRIVQHIFGSQSLKWSIQAEKWKYSKVLAGSTRNFLKPTSRKVQSNKHSLLLSLLVNGPLSLRNLCVTGQGARVERCGAFLTGRPKKTPYKQDDFPPNSGDL